MLSERMKIVISPAWGPKCGSRSPFSGLFAPRSALWADSGRTTATMSWHSPRKVAHPHLVGRFVIWGALPPHEREALQMIVSDPGGPASSVPDVSTQASIQEMNMALMRPGLPFVFVDADGSEER